MKHNYKPKPKVLQNTSPTSILVWDWNS